MRGTCLAFFFFLESAFVFHNKQAEAKMWRAEAEPNVR